VSDQGKPKQYPKVDAVMAGELAGGEFKRQDSRFRDWVGVDQRSGEKSAFEVEPGRYRLYVSLACPWCHRVAIVRELAGLQENVPISYVAPFRDKQGWAFTGESFEVGRANSPEHWVGRYVDELNGWKFMSEGYLASDPSFSARVTVPVLWDAQTGRIVNNESSDIIRMMGAADSLGGLGNGSELQLYPPALAPEIDDVNIRVYDTVNNGVYNAGFARRQTSYERAFKKLFESFQWLEELLGERRYLLGERVCEADWRLFPTLVRFDEVYHVHFRCNYRRVVEYPNLWGYTRELYQWPGVARTVAMEQIKRHYYTTHDELNPKHIIPLGPAPDWTEPHGRG
jgi:putative glutathione S-transferase